MIKLSICIPTYNFGKFIGETLDSILPQVNSEVEVIVLDGGSTDETGSIIRSKQNNYPQLKYFYQDYRGGIDCDIETAVSYSQGIYCWLFSADDIMLAGAIDTILNSIQTDYDIYICEHVLCDFNVNPIRKHPPFKTTAPKLFNLADDLQKNEYFSTALTSEAFFSFLSGPIFKRDIWYRANIPESFYGTCWIVAGHLLTMIPEGLMVSYLSKVLIHKRGDNDSFADQGLVNRYRIAIETFHHISSTVFGEHSKEMSHIRRVLRHEISFRYLIKAKLWASKNPDTEDIKVLNRIVKLHYGDAGFKNTLKYLIYKLTPITIIEIVSSFKKYIAR